MSWHFPRRSPSVTAPQTPPPYTGVLSVRVPNARARREAVRARARECTGARQCACASVTATTTVCCCSARSRFSQLARSLSACVCAPVSRYRYIHQSPVNPARKPRTPRRSLARSSAPERERRRQWGGRATFVNARAGTARPISAEFIAYSSAADADSASFC